MRGLNIRRGEMKKGDVVTIYEDPITQKKPEGRARLISRDIKAVGDGLEYWSVQFLEDYEDITQRFIKRYIT